MDLRYHPTTCVLPPWADRRVMTEGVENFSFEPPSVEQITDVFDIDRIRLEVSPMFPEFGKALDTGDVIDQVAEEYPVDGEEIVGWMHEATAMKIVSSAREVEYNKHSLYVSDTGDGYVPGVQMSGAYFLGGGGNRGSDVGRRGYVTSVSPAGRVNIPAGGKGDLIGPDFLGWAAVPSVWRVQWSAKISQVRRLTNRVTDPTGFPSYKRQVAPLYELQEPPEETERATTEMTLFSDRRQTMHFTFRNPDDYTEVVDEGDVEIPRGRSRLSFVTASYPSVPPLVAQQQPEDGSRTVLRRFEVT